MNRYFCTLFDKNYLTRGLALHSSLINHCPDFHLWVLCMDETTFEIVSKLTLEKVTLIKLADFADPELLAVKQTRSAAEFCWTCTPSLPLYVFTHFSEVDLISYLDADLYFYSSPEPIFSEFGQNSIMIIPHRFVPHRKDYVKTVGIYNVSMVTFRRDKNGMKCLSWWRQKCLAWCFHRYEKTRMGDQKYLDQFPKLFKKVHILNHIGAGVGTWNVGQYRAWNNNGQVFINDAPLIFYHFADLEIYNQSAFLLPSPLGNYGELGIKRTLIYEQYFKEIYHQTNKVRQHFPNFSHGLTRRKKIFTVIKDEIVAYSIDLKRKLSSLLDQSAFLHD